MNSARQHQLKDTHNAATIDWPTLVRLDTPELPSLDISDLPSWCSDFIKALSEDTETPTELAAGTVLSVCATAAARRIQVEVKTGYIEPCNLWILVALPSGNRKSAVHRAAIEPLIIWEREQLNALQHEINVTTSIVKTNEARVKELRTKAAKEKDAEKAKAYSLEAATIESALPQVPSAPKLWTSDVTPERLGTLLADNEERMAWLSSEGGMFELLQGRYSGGIPNLDLFLKAHSGDPERVDRGCRASVILDNPLLTVGLSPQPDVLRGLARKPGFRGRGLLARFLYLLPSSPLGYRTLQSKPIPQNIRDNYHAGIRKMLELKSNADDEGKASIQTLRLNEEAFAEYIEFAKAVEVKMRPGGDLEQFTDWASKAPGAGVRLAGILHGMRYSQDCSLTPEISKETLTTAMDIISIITTHSLAAFNLMGADPMIASAERVLSWIKRNHYDQFTLRNSFNALRSQFKDVASLREVIAILEERGYVKLIETKTSGAGRPPSPTIVVRPDMMW